MDTVNPKCTTKITKNGISNKPTKQKTRNHRKQMRQRENKDSRLKSNHINHNKCEWPKYSS